MSNRRAGWGIVHRTPWNALAIVEVMMSMALLIDIVGGLSIRGVFETSSGLAGGRHIILLLDLVGLW